MTVKLTDLSVNYPQPTVFSKNRVGQHFGSKMLKSAFLWNIHTRGNVNK